MENKKLLREILSKYSNGAATAEETKFVEHYYRYFEKEIDILDNFPNGEKQVTETRMLKKINDHIKTPVIAINRKKLFLKISAAAAVVFFAVSAVCFYKAKTPDAQDLALMKARKFAPGKPGAILTFEHNGKSIILDTAKNGDLGNGVSKSANDITVNSNIVEYATLVTPKARTQQLVLPDGSIVWLNAASSIHFPTKFVGKERVVEITGEVDIQVAHNATMPFKTIAKGQVFEDIGTEFNINAYNDEPVIKTTLLEGAIKTNHVILKPGQQTVVDRATMSMSIIKDADTQQAVAWKNGLFSFDDQTDLNTVMRQIGRWYDVEISYQGTIQPMRFGGKITRNCNLSDVLQILQYSNVHFKIDGRKLIVTP